MSRPTKTYLIHANAVKLRVDLKKGAQGYDLDRVLRLEPEPSQEPDPFNPTGNSFDTDWVSSLLSLKPKPAVAITVLTDQVTAAVVDMPSSPGEDWRSSAEMEAQTYSGLSTSEAVTACNRLAAEEGMLRCWVVQAAMKDVIGLRQAVQKVAKKSELVNIGHPAGIHLDLKTPQVECWNDFALYHAADGDKINLRGWNGPDALIDLFEDGEIAGTLTTEWEQIYLLLGGIKANALEQNPPNTLDLAETTASETWAEALAGACDPLTGRILGMPVLTVPKAPPSNQAFIMKVVAITAVTAALVTAHYLFNKKTITELTTQIDNFDKPAKAKAKADKRIQEIDRELKKMTLSKGNKKKVVPKFDVNAHCERMAHLLEGIARGEKIAGVVISEIKPSGKGTVVYGVASVSSAPQQLTTRFNKNLTPFGWQASLEKRTAKLLQDNGGPWTYQIRLSPPAKQNP